jgi:imidazolonepropionase
MLIHSASQLLTLAGDPQRGLDLGRLGILPDGAVLLRNEVVEAVGASADLRRRYPDEPALDASGCVVMPGFVDPHTHAIWMGDRAAEFEMRLQGKTYLEILAAGGGILSTVRQTRQASVDDMVSETRPRLHTMLSHGTTTAEVKTGYGLETATELRMLAALLRLDGEGPLELAFTFLGAHAVAPEYKDDPDGYTSLVDQKMLPEVLSWWQEQAPGRPLPFVDVFCETGAFNLLQSRRILQAARHLDFPLKIHADEFDNLGGASLAVELGAISADHLVKSSPQDIQALGQSATVAVALPCTPFGLAEREYTPASQILQAGGLLALASDLNPGTAWSGDMQFAIALACRYMRLTPAQAIAAATINAAAALGMADRVGSLEVGKQADLLLLSVPDYRHLGYRFGPNLVQSVVKKGCIVWNSKTGLKSSSSL